MNIFSFLNRALQMPLVLLVRLFIIFMLNLAFPNPILGWRRSDNIGTLTTGLKAQSTCRSRSTKTTTVHQSVQGIISVNQWLSEYVSQSASWQLVLKVNRDITTKLRLLWRNSPFKSLESSSWWPLPGSKLLGCPVFSLVPQAAGFSFLELSYH